MSACPCSAGTALGTGTALDTHVTAPAKPFAVGVRQYAWTRGNRKLNTFVYYPAKGAPGGSPATNAPVADGVFPICEFMHGFSSSPQKSLSIIRPLAEAGFVVPAPYFASLNINDVYNGNQSKDVSEIITHTLALNPAGRSAGRPPRHGCRCRRVRPLDGRYDHARPADRMAGHQGHRRDSDVHCGRGESRQQGTRQGPVHARGTRTGPVPFPPRGRRTRNCPRPRLSLTFRGASHSSYFGDARARTTFLDWMRWSLYGDTAARDRLPADATSGKTTWESAL